MEWIRDHVIGVFLVSLLGSVVALSVAIGVIVKASVNDGVHVAELRACHRVNVIRAATNRTNRADFQEGQAQYAYDVLFARLIVAGLKHQTSSVKRTPEQERQTKLFLAKLTAVASRVKAATDAKEWIALTDCHRAVYSASYRPSAPVRFSQRQPPGDVYVVGPGN